MNLGLNFQLIPPGHGADNAARVVDSRGNELGALGSAIESPGNIIARNLGWVSTDTIESGAATAQSGAAAEIDNIVNLFGNVNVSVHVAGHHGGKDPIQAQYNSLDPSQPFPLINSRLYQTALQQLYQRPNERPRGPIDPNAATVHSTPLPPDTTVDPTQGTQSTNAPLAVQGKTNIWLSGNVYVAFLEAFMEMMRMLKQSKAVEGNIEVNMMKATVDFAKTEARLIMKIAKQQQTMYIASAVFAGFTCGLSIASLGMTSLNIGRIQANRFKEPAPDPMSEGVNTAGERVRKNPNQLADETAHWEARRSAHDNTTIEGTNYSVTSLQQSIAMWGGISAMAQSLNSMGTNIFQASIAIPVAMMEGYKTMVQVYRQMMQHIMEKATDKSKQDTEQIAQLISLLDSIRQKLADAVAAALRK